MNVRRKGVLATLIVALLFAGTHTTQAASPSFGLEWPGDGAVRRMLFWHNPFPIYDATYVFKVFPRKKVVPTNSPTGYYTTFFWGNNGLLAGNWSTPGGVSNKVDTVENVFVQRPAAGTWTVEVRADEVNADGHVETPATDADFALVVTA